MSSSEAFAKGYIVNSKLTVLKCSIFPYYNVPPKQQKILNTEPPFSTKGMRVLTKQCRLLVAGTFHTLVLIYSSILVFIYSSSSFYRIHYIPPDFAEPFLLLHLILQTIYLFQAILTVDVNSVIEVQL